MVIFRIIRNLLRLGFGLLLIPIALMSRSVFGLILLIILGVVIYGTFSGDEKPKPDAKNQIAPIIQAVTTVEDGNSSFATDLIKKMLPEERVTYSQMFYWAMRHLEPGQHYPWAKLNIAGEFTVTESFTNKTGARCKRFKETLKVHEIKQTLNSLACEQKNGAWCKLHRNATPACGLGQEPNSWRDFQRSLGNMF